MKKRVKYTNVNIEKCGGWGGGIIRGVAIIRGNTVYWLRMSSEKNTALQL